MATLKIEPISTTTTGGLPATITGIDINNGDCFEGTITLPDGTKNVLWNKNGLCRDGNSDESLNKHSPEFEDIKALLDVFLKR